MNFQKNKINVVKVVISELVAGDMVTVYLYTNTATADRKTNHFTSFSGLLLRHRL